MKISKKKIKGLGSTLKGYIDECTNVVSFSEVEEIDRKIESTKRRKKK